MKFSFRPRVVAVFMLIACLGMATTVLAQDAQPLPPSTNPTNRAIFPSQGQDESQQMNDQLECYRWATKQTGWDPYVAYDELVAKGYVAQQSVDQAQGGLVKGAAGGAALGAMIGAVAGDAGKGAAIGAIAGGLTKGARSKKQTSSAEQQMKQANDAFQQQLQVWDRNYVAALEGHGYTVK